MVGYRHTATFDAREPGSAEARFTVQCVDGSSDTKAATNTVEGETRDNERAAGETGMDDTDGAVDDRDGATKELEEEDPGIARTVIDGLTSDARGSLFGVFRDALTDAIFE